ncbi:membrane protein [Bacteroidota bacterium]|nr:membrane protein [Bacteroidota bacterium]
MKTNMGTVDRIFRLLIAVVIAILYMANQITGTTAIILLILAGVFILTSVISFCPLYLPFGLSTKKKTDQ